MPMADKRNFGKILEPGRIGRVQTKNRIIKTCGGEESRFRASHYRGQTRSCRGRKDPGRRKGGLYRHMQRLNGRPGNPQKGCRRQTRGYRPLRRLRRLLRSALFKCHKEITDKGLIVTTGEGKKQMIEADTIITAASPRPNTELLKAIEGKVPEAYLIGSEDKESCCIMNAIGNGYRIAKAI